MADQPQLPLVIDPDNVPETLCDGQFNLSFSNQSATITFTHWRPEATQMVGGALALSAIVRARIVLSLPNLIALRDFLSANVQTIPITDPPAPTTGGATKH